MPHQQLGTLETASDLPAGVAAITIENADGTRHVYVRDDLPDDGLRALLAAQRTLGTIAAACALAAIPLQAGAAALLASDPTLL